GRCFGNTRLGELAAVDRKKAETEIDRIEAPEAGEKMGKQNPFIGDRLAPEEIAHEVGAVPEQNERLPAEHRFALFARAGDAAPRLRAGIGRRIAGGSEL